MENKSIDMTRATERIKELSVMLRRASEAYYAKDEEIISNLEYDRLYDELVELEEKTGIVLSMSPTRTVGYEAVDFLPKERHEKPMLSLGKTKSREELREWLIDKEGLLSWKLDGLTIVLTYEEGKLKKAVTRGNGEVGEVITPNARVFVNVPDTIPYQGRLILRGEAVISYSDFEKINEEMQVDEAKYKNPRNLCSGSVRQLNNEITARRNVCFYAFSFVSAEGGGSEPDFHNDRENQFLFLRELGFDVVPFKRVSADTILDAVEEYAQAVQTYDIPSDGLVLTYCDLAYSASLGQTAKFPRDSIAFKWQDEVAETTLREIEWSPSRTGAINPVAVFEPVELEGTTVSRASVHNVSVVKALKLGIGDRITVYKANMIIPQIAENLTASNALEIPEHCPACAGPARIHAANDAQTLVCENPDCPAKKIKAFTLFVSRDALNIDGLSEATLEKLIAKGFIHEFTDIFHLDRYRDEIIEMEGFGEKSYQKLAGSIEKARQTTLPRVVYALGIPGIGAANAKLLCRFFGHDIEQLRDADAEDLAMIEGIGSVLAESIAGYFKDAGNRERLAALLSELEISMPEQTSGEQTLEGKVFVITGSVTHFANRNEVKELIEAKGGKVTGSVTSKTDYLINNDVTSTSGKNKKAKELGIPVISEEDFLQMLE